VPRRKVLTEAQAGLAYIRQQPQIRLLVVIGALNQLPTQEESERQQKPDRFQHSLQSIARSEVRLGKLECRGLNAQGKPTFE
jgi:hypothetical protein